MSCFRVFFLHPLTDAAFGMLNDVICLISNKALQTVLGLCVGAGSFPLSEVCRMLAKKLLAVQLSICKNCEATPRLIPIFSNSPSSPSIVVGEVLIF